MNGSASTPNDNLESGRNHTMADTLALISQRASHYVAIFLSSTVGACSYFLQQNDAIRNGTVKGQIINLTALGMGNPAIVWYFQCLAIRPVINVRS